MPYSTCESAGWSVNHVIVAAVPVSDPAWTALIAGPLLGGLGGGSCAGPCAGRSAVRTAIA